MFTDIHCHILYGVDDGTDSYENMINMLDFAYADGIRCICATPHFNHAFYGDNIKDAKQRFSELEAAAKDKYPDMKLYFGCEIFYHNECLSLLESGMCPTLAGTKYLLCDFLSTVDAYTVAQAIKGFISFGFRPILAHTERYRFLSSSVKNIRLLSEAGAIIQINAPSVIGKNSLFEKRTSRKLIKQGLCDIISTDAHNLTDRTFCMKECSVYLKKHYGELLCAQLMNDNAQAILHGNRIK